MHPQLPPPTVESLRMVCDWQGRALDRLGERLGIIGCVKFDEIVSAAIARLDSQDETIRKLMSRRDVT